MKKILAWMLAAAMFLTLTACGNREISDQNPSGSSSTEESSQPEESRPEPAEESRESSAPSEESSEAPVSSEPEPSSEPESSAESEQLPVTEADISRIKGEWITLFLTPEGEERQCHLILSEDYMAQLVIQDGVGSLLGLSMGSWKVLEPELISMELTCLMKDGVNLEEADQIPLGGEYLAVPGIENSLTISCPPDSDPLFPAHEWEPYTFYPLGEYLMGTSPLS